MNLRSLKNIEKIGRSSAIDSTDKKKSPFVLLYFACQEKSLGINANHSLFKKSLLKCFFFSSDKEVISKVDKTITRKANLHTLSSIIVQSADSEGLTFDSSWGLGIFSLSHTRDKMRKKIFLNNDDISINPHRRHPLHIHIYFRYPSTIYQI